MSALVAIGAAAANLFILVPVKIASRFLQWLSTFLLVLPFILLAIGLGLLFGVGFGAYGDVAIEEAEYLFRCVLYPSWRDFVRPIITLLRFIYNWLICWWNGINWWAYGLWYRAIIPTALECGVSDMAQAGGQWLLALFEDLVVDYFVSGDFFTQEMDFTNINTRWITFWEQWQALIACGCNDLSLFFRLQPIVFINMETAIEAIEGGSRMPPEPVPKNPLKWLMFNPLYLVGADQVKDPQFLCAVSNFFNAAFTAFHVVWRVLIQVLTLQPIEPRPSLKRPLDLLCEAVKCFVRSCENVMQLFTDNFLPWEFKWDNFLCVLDSLICILLKTLSLLVDVLVNIDQVVFYPTNPYWGTTVKREVIVLLNLWAPVTYKDYNLDPLTDPSFNETRLTECICIFITRLICDPTNVDTACFDSGAQEILGAINFDFCCLTNTLLQTLVNALAFLFEFTLRFNSLDLFFEFLDDNFLTWLIKDEVIRLADCLLSILGLIPVVGPCIKTILLQFVTAVVCWVDFLVKLLLGLATMPYWLVVGQNNFILEPQRARDEFLAFNEVLSANGTNTFMNCLCFVLNGAFPIPYIPCTSCSPVGFEPPMDPSKRYEAFFGDRFAPSKRILHYPGENLSPRQYIDRIYANSHDFQDKVRRTDDWQLKRIMNPAENYGGVIAERMKAQRQIVGDEPAQCPQPYQPAFGECTRPDCFDVCCLLRTTLQATAQLLRMVAFGLDSLIHESQGPGEMNYFINGQFEVDLTRLIELSLLPLQCVCNFLEFVFPVPNLDLCGPIRELGNLIAGLLLVIINGIKSLALDNPNFTYFTSTVTIPNFRQDVNDLSDISLRIVQALCDIFRAVLPIPVFDICCFADRLWSTIVETIRWLVNTIINLALINSGGMAYFTTGGGFATEGEVVITSIFGMRGGCCNQGTGGLVNCICGVINAIFPFRQFPGAPISGNNCPTLDLCCAINEVGFFAGDVLRFGLNLLVSLFQPWVNGIPTGFVEFWVCNDLPNTLQTSCIYNTTSNAFECFQSTCMFQWSTLTTVCTSVQLSPNCGRLQPLFEDLQRLLECPCVVLGFLDQLLSEALGSQWECFCGTGQSRPGIIRAIASFVTIILEKWVEFFRLFVTDAYWSPANWTCPGGGNTCSQKSFALFVLGRIVDEFCELVFSVTCFLDAWFGTNACFFTQRNLVFAIVRWPFELVIRIIDVFQGIVDAFVNGCGTSSFPNISGTDIPSQYEAIEGGCIGGGLSSLFSFVIDALIADGQLPDTVSGVSELPTCGSILVNVTQEPSFPVDCSCYAGTVNDAYQCPNTNIAPFLLRRCYRYLPGSNDTCDYGLGGLGDSLEGCAAPPQTETQGVRLDGIVIALLRHITCLLNANGLAGVAKATEGLTVFFSFVWQLTARIFEFVGGLVDFIISLFSFDDDSPCGCHTDIGYTCQAGALCYPPAMVGCNLLPPQPARPLCTVIWVFERAFSVLAQFFNIFSSPPVVPPTQVPLKRRDMSQQDMQNVTTTDTIEQVVNTLWGFDTSDCIDDPIACVKRNLPGAVINVTEPMATGDMIQALDAFFTPGTNVDTTCQNIIHMCAAKGDTWDTVEYSLKTQYAECLVNRIRAERIRMYLPTLPADIFYNHFGPVEVLHWIKSAVDDANEGDVKREQQRQTRRVDESFIPGETIQGRCARHTERYMFGRHMMTEQGWKHPELKSIFLALDQREQWIRSGEMMHDVERAHRNVMEGRWEISSWSAFKRMTGHAGRILSFVGRADYRGGATTAYRAIRGLYDDTSDIMSRGLLSSMRGLYTKEATKVRRLTRAASRQNELMWEAFYQGPFYQWWNSTQVRTMGDLYGYGNVTVREHMSRVMDHHRKRHSAMPFNYLDNVIAIKDSIVRRWEPRWTPEKRRNNEQVAGVFYKIYNAFVPQHQGIQERFIIGGNCKVVDRGLDMTVELIQYCANEFVANIPAARQNDALVEFAKRSRWFSHPNVQYYDHPNETRWRNSDYEHSWEHEHLKLDRGERIWNRGRIVYPETVPRRMPKNIRAVLTPTPTFNLMDWILCRIDDLLVLLGGSTASGWLAQAIVDVQAFVLNTNTDILAAPVGLLYWVQFPFVCQFPLNLNCSVGIGLEAAIGFAVLWTFILFVLVALIFPSVLTPLAIVSFLLYVVLVPAMAWHYSPRCWLMTPAASWLPGTIPFTDLVTEDAEPIAIPLLSTLKAGIDVPFWFFPIAFPALPECLLDDLVALGDKWLTDCYLFLQDTGLWWLLPPEMVNGAICPVCPEKIDFANCRDVGMADGLANLIYLIYWLWPGFCDFVVNVLQSTCLFNECLIDLSFVVDLLDTFKMATDTQTFRFNWCFWATVGTLLMFVALLALAFGLLAFIIPSVIDIVAGLWLLIVSPLLGLFAVAIDENQTVLPEDDEDDDEAVLPRQPAPVGWGTRFNRAFDKYIVGLKQD